MTARRLHGWRRFTWPALLGMSMSVVGCQSGAEGGGVFGTIRGWFTFSGNRPAGAQAKADSAPNSSQAVLAPHTEMEWVIWTGDQPPVKHMHSRSTVSPDGTIELGPYGTQRVAGMTVAQAKTAIEQQLKQHLTQPRVALRVTPVTMAPPHGLAMQTELTPLPMPAPVNAMPIPTPLAPASGSNVKTWDSSAGMP